ncbi:AsmA-like C-terminal region-containing protein [Methylobacterium sp. J-067]|uniref:AsmA-like C-terminal region-containing protein n=1 Tax=Methylobacterium sp. J-067 TaxID=2836648 RepID=UPI001FB86792|nr:AsmA-like C-terminal region-containing protein [Methylobacterium sp. J-067]MCJ2027556.1 AsmA protein [Methylobacterium sp. J-067]
MRDLLTALAGAIVLVLIAALAVPPFIDWTAHRAFIDRTLSQSLGVPVQSQGRVEVRLLPSPRLRVDRLVVGGRDGPALDARFVKSEIALAPLLKGEARFTETRVGRAEIRLPVSEGESVHLPRGLLDGLRTKDLAIENLQIQQFLVTTAVRATGRTDQFTADDVRVQAPSLVGPWRVEATSGGVPFRAVSGTPDPEGRLPVKISGGGDASPLFEVDARFGLALDDTDSDASIVRAEGTARLVVGPPSQAAGAYLPFTLSGAFKSRGTQVRFDQASVDIDPGGKTLHLEGTGRLDLHQWRAALSLKARRLDLDAFLTSTEGGALLARGIPRGGWGLPVMLDLDVAVDSAAFGAAEWSDIAVAGTAERGGGLLIRRLAATGPGEARITASGEIEGAPLRLTGPVSLLAKQSDALGRLLRRLGAEGPWLSLFDGRALDLSADVAASPSDLSLRNLRAGFGTARLSGNARYVAPEAGTRGRFEAQLLASGLDIAALPPSGTALSALRDMDLALTLQAKDVRFGSVGSGAGTIAARIQSDGGRLVVDSLDVSDLAGASAKLSGSLAADGTGRIAGRLQAPAAAPLVGLLERVWSDELQAVPAFLRTAPLDLAVVLDRDAPESGGLRVQAKGKAGGGTLDLAVRSRDGRFLAGNGTLSTPHAGSWFGRTDIPGLQQPADLRFTAEPRGAVSELRLPKEPEGMGFALTVAGTVAGLSIGTDQPILLPAKGAAPEGGRITLRTADLAPFLTLAGAARLEPGAWPADLTATLSADGGDPQAAVSGAIAGSAVEGTLIRGGDGALRGRARLAQLSLPRLAAALLMPLEGGRPGPLPARPQGSLDLGVARLDLGRGLVASDAAFTFGLEPDTLTLGGLTARLADGRLSGSATLARRGDSLAVTGEGSAEDLSLGALSGGRALTGRLTAGMRFAASANALPALAANLAGSGRLTLKDLAVSGLDPAALGRALALAAEAEDPLREGRLGALVSQELGKAGAQAPAPVSAPATIVGGVLRAGPLDIDLGPARWTGSVTEDLREGRLDARGTLAGGAVPPGWPAGPPSVQYALTGSLADPARSLDAGPLATGLAAFVLQRELESLELNEADQIERQRRRDRIELDKTRAAALKAYADKLAAEEAERQARERSEAPAPAAPEPVSPQP